MSTQVKQNVDDINITAVKNGFLVEINPGNDIRNPNSVYIPERHVFNEIGDMFIFLQDHFLEIKEDENDN